MKLANAASPLVSAVAFILFLAGPLPTFADEVNGRKTETKLSVEQAWELVSAGEHAKAEQAADQLLEEAISNSDMEYEYKALNLKIALQYIQNKYTPKVLRKEQRLEAIALHLGDEERIAAVSNNLGYDLLVAGKAPVADIIPRMERANAYYAKKEKGDGRWYTLMNLNWAHRLAGNLPASRDYGLKSVKTAKAIKDRHAIIETCINLAETLMLEGKQEEAGKYFAKAKKYADQQADRDKHVFDVYYARYLLADKQIVGAIELLKAAIPALQDVEIFYAALGQAILAEAMYAADEVAAAEGLADAVMQATDKFVSRDAIVLASLVKAKVLKHRGQDVDAARLLDAMREELAPFASPLLNDMLQS
ncbi:MAG: hypothetical protein AAF431_11320 [Pseudomonadota bacterium]